MLKLLEKKLVWKGREPDQVIDADIRMRYGMLAGSVGVIFNLLLFAVKYPIGLMTGSMAVIADALNNITDMASSGIALIGAKLANKKPDEDHPYGYGRIEYLSVLAVSFIIILVGFELLQEAYEKLLHPTPVSFEPLMYVILAVTVGVKFFLYFYTEKIAGIIDSGVLRATAYDCHHDGIATAVVIVCSLIGPYINFPLDSLCSLVLAVMVMRAGWNLAREGLKQLLGGKPDPEMVKSIKRLLAGGEAVMGVHDLVVHDYGPGRIMASAHVEIPEDADMIKAHAQVDALERKIRHELDIPIILHIDIIAAAGELSDGVRDDLIEVIRSKAPGCAFHNLRIINKEERVVVIFDLSTPLDMNQKESDAAIDAINDAMREKNPAYSCVIEARADLSSTKGKDKPEGKDKPDGKDKNDAS